MSSRFKQFLRNIARDRKIIFDLDETIWQCTIEYEPNITLNRVRASVNPETYKILQGFQSNGNSLNIASRSSEPDKCKYYINNLFPEIKFDNISIYPTPEFKVSHIQECYNNNTPTDFIMFDDEKNILDNLKYTYPKSLPFHCTKSLHYKMF